MKGLFVRTMAIVALTILSVVQTMAQEKFAYQAVIRDSEGNLVTQGTVGLKFSLTNGGKTYYVETQTATPNQYGNVSVIIGDDKNKVSGSMADVPWSTLDITMKVEVDVKGGTNYKLLGETKLTPAPYALYAPKGGGAASVGSATKDGATLFEVNDRNGNPVFAVTDNGIVVYVDDTDSGKVRRSGFYITGRESKGGDEKDYFSVTTDGTQIYVTDDDSKVRRSGFYITGRESKGGQNDYLTVDGKGTTVYVDANGEDKARRSGFYITGREADKGADNKMFAVDGGQTTVYVDDLGDSKVRRSGFLITGRDAKSADNYVEISGTATMLKTETLTVTNSPRTSDPATEAPASVLTVTNQTVEMKSDIAMTGDVEKKLDVGYDKSYQFDLNFVAYSSGLKQLNAFDLLKDAGVEIDENDISKNYGFHLLYYYGEGSFVNAYDRMYFNSSGAIEKNDNYIINVFSEGSMIGVSCEGSDIKKFSFQFGVQYEDLYAPADSPDKGVVLFTVNVTIDKMLYPYTTEKGTAKYLIRWNKPNHYEFYQSQMLPIYSDPDRFDTIQYVFNDYGWDNFEGVTHNEIDDEIDQPFKYLAHINWRIATDYYLSDRLEKSLMAWTRSDGGYWGYGDQNSGLFDSMKWPMFSLAGVNTYLSGGFDWEFADYSNFYCISGSRYGIDINEITSNGTSTITVNGKPYNVDKYTHSVSVDSTGGNHSGQQTRTFYVYKGVVLQIDLTYSSGATSNILKCLEFNEGKADPSFHRWLKNSGVTNYDGMVNESNYPQYNDCSYIDLGLPSGNLWAAFNVGAPTPYDWGDYLAWGENTEKENYSQGNTQPDTEQPFWSWEGSEGWVVPNNSDWLELVFECLWVWVEGENGARVYPSSEYPQNKGTIMYIADLEAFYSSPEAEMVMSGPYLFLPMSGSYSGTSINNLSKGLYWSSNSASCIEFGITNKQVRVNSPWEGLQVRPVVHKGKTIYINPSNTDRYPDGSEGNPYKSITEALNYMDDELTSYTLMITGNVEPASISTNYDKKFKQITLRGARGLGSNNVPQDAIVGNTNQRPLTVQCGNITIKNLRLTGGGIDPTDNDIYGNCAIAKGGGLYVSDATVVLDSGAYVMGNAACATSQENWGIRGGRGGGVYVDGGQLIMRNSAKICDNRVGGNSYYGEGGGVYVDNYGFFRLDGGTISNNIGVGVSNSVSGYTVGPDHDNYVYSSGGGVAIEMGDFMMSGGLITENKILETPEAPDPQETSERYESEHGKELEQVITHGMGGGVYASPSATINMTGGEISGNISSVASGITVLSVDEGGLTQLSMSGDSYIDNICLASINGGMSSYYILLNGSLTTNKQMNITCASVENYAELGDENLVNDLDEEEEFFVLYSWNGQSVRNSISKFKVTNSGYAIRFMEDEDYYVGKLVKKQ